MGVGVSAPDGREWTVRRSSAGPSILFWRPWVVEAECGDERVAFEVTGIRRSRRALRAVRDAIERGEPLFRLDLS